jgi:hypothetical protein
MVKVTQPATESPRDLTLDTIAPEWVELSKAFQELCAREDELIARARGQKKDLDGSGLALFSEQNIAAIRTAAAEAGKPPRMFGASEKAAALLGKFTPAPVAAPLPLAHEPKFAREARETNEDIAAVREAIAALRPQLTRAHLEGSARLCKQLTPEYSGIARRICVALVELGKAEMAHKQFMHRHRGAERSTLRPVPTDSLGNPLDQSSQLRRLLDWAIESGHFDFADLPAEWGARRNVGQIRSWPTT